MQVLFSHGAWTAKAEVDTSDDSSARRAWDHATHTLGLTPQMWVAVDGVGRVVMPVGEQLAARAKERTGPRDQALELRAHSFAPGDAPRPTLVELAEAALAARLALKSYQAPATAKSDAAESAESVDATPDQVAFALRSIVANVDPDAASDVVVEDISRQASDAATCAMVDAIVGLRGRARTLVLRPVQADASHGAAKVAGKGYVEVPVDKRDSSLGALKALQDHLYPDLRRDARVTCAFVACADAAFLAAPPDNLASVLLAWWWHGACVFGDHWRSPRVRRVVDDFTQLAVGAGNLRCAIYPGGIWAIERKGPLAARPLVPFVVSLPPIPPQSAAGAHSAAVDKAPEVIIPRPTRPMATNGPRGGFGLPVPVGWTYFAAFDSPGGDRSVWPAATNLHALLALADLDPSIVAFNCGGYLKTRLRPLREWLWIGDDTGTYVRNSVLASLDCAEAAPGFVEPAGKQSAVPAAAKQSAVGPVAAPPQVAAASSVATLPSVCTEAFAAKHVRDAVAQPIRDAVAQPIRDDAAQAVGGGHVAARAATRAQAAIGASASSATGAAGGGGGDVVQPRTAAAFRSHTGVVTPFDDSQATSDGAPTKDDAAPSKSDAITWVYYPRRESIGGDAVAHALPLESAVELANAWPSIRAVSSDGRLKSLLGSPDGWVVHDASCGVGLYVRLPYAGETHGQLSALPSGPSVACTCSRRRA